jgi:hypothetical protein
MGHKSLTGKPACGVAGFTVAPTSAITRTRAALMRLEGNPAWGWQDGARHRAPVRVSKESLVDGSMRPTSEICIADL